MQRDREAAQRPFLAFHEPTATVREGRLGLLADVETVNNVEVTLWIDLFQVIQQASSATDQHQQAAPAGEIPLVALQVPGQLVDPRRQDGNLDLGGSGVVIAPLKLPDQTRFPLFCDSHLLPRLLHLGWLRMLLREANSSYRIATTLPTKCVIPKY